MSGGIDNQCRSVSKSMIDFLPTNHAPTVCATANRPRKFAVIVYKICVKTTDAWTRLAMERKAPYTLFTREASDLIWLLHRVRYPLGVNPPFEASTMLESTGVTAEPASGVRLDATARASHNALAAILDPADILLGLDVTTKGQALREIARFVGARHGLSDAAVHAALIEREKIGSTGLGRGVAIPHARVKELARPVAAFVRTQMPIHFDAPDGKPVTDMLVLLVPQQATEEHLLLLAAVAGMFCEEKFRKDLRTCVDVVKVHARLAGRGRREPH